MIGLGIVLWLTYYGPLQLLERRFPRFLEAR
jgi:hypothetical protein